MNNNNKGLIIVNTQAGLSNRLRAIESGLSLAKKLETKCKVIWNIDGSMAAEFSNLFEVPKEFDLISYSRFKYIRNSSRLFGFKKICSKIINYLCGINYVFDNLFIHEKVHIKKIDLVDLCKQRNCYFSTCEAFFNFSFNYTWLKPKVEIEEKVIKFVAILNGRKCIGIHIRRTDNEVSIDQSPDQLFEDAINLEIKKNNNIMFFLATDDLETQNRFVKNYGNKIITHKKDFGRESILATQDALVDLLSLSKCEKMYASYWSSFSETAAIISKGEIIVCKK